MLTLSDTSSLSIRSSGDSNLYAVKVNIERPIPIRSTWVERGQYESIFADINPLRFLGAVHRIWSPSSRGFFSTVLQLGETIICPDLNLAELVAFSPTHSFRIDELSIYLACH